MKMKTINKIHMVLGLLISFVFMNHGIEDLFLTSKTITKEFSIMSYLIALEILLIGFFFMLLECQSPLFKNNFAFLYKPMGKTVTVLFFNCLLYSSKVDSWKIDFYLVLALNIILLCLDYYKFLKAKKKDLSVHDWKKHITGITLYSLIEKSKKSAGPTNQSINFTASTKLTSLFRQSSKSPSEEFTIRDINNSEILGLPKKPLSAVDEENQSSPRRDSIIQEHRPITTSDLYQSLLPLEDSSPSEMPHHRSVGLTQLSGSGKELKECSQDEEVNSQIINKEDLDVSKPSDQVES